MTTDDNHSGTQNSSGPQPEEQVILTAEAKAQGLAAAVQQAMKEGKPSVDSLSMDKIHRAAAGISVGRLRMIIADGEVSAAEVRAVLIQAGLSAEEINQAMEYTRRVIENYARQVVPPDQSLSHVAHKLQAKVDMMGNLLKDGAILPDMKKQSPGESLTASTPGQEKAPEIKQR